MRSTPRPKTKEGAVSFDKLEPSKENIQPLLRSSGKRMHSLARNLQQTPKALTEKQERERRQWETALQRDTSNDPLSLWVKYIRWTKLNFSCPTNQKAQLLPLIERCTRKFKDDPRYTNNKHYLKLWLEYAHLSRDSMEVFKFLHTNKIGQKLSLFWRGWAIVAEQNDQFDLVDRIFNAAKQVNAQPIKDINNKYEAFLARMQKKISSQNIDIHSINYNSDMRSTLGQIQSDNGSVSSHRNNHSKPSGFGAQISQNRHTNPHSNTNDKFGIYCDENEENDNPNRNDINLPPVSSAWKDLGTQYNRSKENTGVPTSWNNQGFGNANANDSVQQTSQSTFAIPMDDELKKNISKSEHKSHRGITNPLITRKATVNVQDKIFANPLANYAHPNQANDPNQPICTHMTRARGPWTQQGRYYCAAFVDPNLLTYDGEECSLEEARCRAMKPRWNLEMEQREEKDKSMEFSEDDMMITVNVGRILYNKQHPELSIPSTIQEEPQSTKSNILTDVGDENGGRKNRKRKNSDESVGEVESDNGLHLQPSKKRFKLTQNVLNERGNCEDTFDVFSELTTATNLTNTLHSHYETPMRKLDFATPSIMTQNGQSMHGNHASSEDTTDVQSMTAFFANPIKISDKRMCDTPTVNATMKTKTFNPTATVTYHTKAAMNDIVKIFGANQNENKTRNTAQIQNQNQNVCNGENGDGFGIYEDTHTIHERIDINNEKMSIYEDTQTIHANINIDGIILGNSVPNVDALSVSNDISELPLPLPANSDIDMKEREQILIVDPLDCSVMNEYGLMIMKSMGENVMDFRDMSAPISIESLLNGETDIELDDDNDVYLNVTDYIQSLSEDSKQYIFVVNDLSQDEDTERMLIVNCPLSLKSYYITSILRGYGFDESRKEYALAESVYLYKDLSFTLCKITDTFNTLENIVLKANESESELHEKLILYYVTEILRVVSQLHGKDMIHSNLRLQSFVVKLAECNSISCDWNDRNDDNGWEQFGLLLHDLHNCLKISDFIDWNENTEGSECGFRINANNLENNNKIMCLFQKFINNRVWSYEVDYFGICLIIIQLLMQTSDGNVIESIIGNIYNDNNNIIEEIDKYREGNGLEKLQNGILWNKVLDMLLMRNDSNSNVYEFDNLEIENRRSYLKNCYKHCATELMDLENLSPKLQIILARLDRMIQT